MLAVLYARVADDKDLGVLMTGIYFGGLAEDEKEADAIAQKCVCSIQGGLVIPKIAPVNNDDLMGAIDSMTVAYERLADHMYDNERVVEKSYDD